MSTVRSTLLARHEIAQGTVSYHFSKPEGFMFRPGQAVDILLPLLDASVSREARVHAFSLVNAPDESELVFAMRRRDSAYKRALDALPLGAEVEIDGPFGSLLLHKNPARAGVLIAGGIGVTPFMSMIRHAVQQQSAQPLALLYANHCPEEAAFLAELQAHSQAWPTFSLHATMTRMTDSSAAWQGETGSMDAAFIQRAVVDLPAPIFYVSGPPSMVHSLRESLNQSGIDEDDVRSEEFYGY